MRSHSFAVWNLDWSKHLPLELENGMHCELATVEESLAFTQAHYASIFGLQATDTRFLPDPTTPAKRRFLELSDRFVLRDGGRTVGLLIGHPADWSTYYWRTAALIRSHQGKNAMAQVTVHTDRVMAAHGIERIDIDVAPINHQQLRLVLKLGYRTVGTINSERWGAFVHMTKFLSPRGEETFANQFCRDVFPTSPIRANSSGGSHEEVRTRLPVMDLNS